MFERFTDRAKKVLELSLREALQLGHNYISTEHILLGLIREGEGVGALALRNLGVDLAEARQEVIRILSSQPSTAPTEKTSPPSADQWTEDARANLSRQKPYLSPALVTLLDAVLAQVGGLRKRVAGIEDKP